MKGKFHIAFATADMTRAKRFYGDLLGCKIGRESTAWADFDFFGHQMSIHKIAEKVRKPRNYYNPNSHIPANHFGIILSWADWHKMEEKLKASRINFLVEPHLAFEGEIGEQKTMFIQDPDGNSIEFKSFEDPKNIFAV
ncbi:glyoxalase [Cryomorpha ignava]|uniref:Glyoxalase n=1 Tax=Cryomorpha ignava TaxID=101383 RepID=A0A7K3WV56_9FLAO|nr:VOC family protein [Cryomorpha ignava]NEN25573.1 glyoxalase [Cryomorpha ignava]